MQCQVFWLPHPYTPSHHLINDSGKSVKTIKRITAAGTAPKSHRIPLTITGAKVHIIFDIPNFIAILHKNITPIFVNFLKNGGNIILNAAQSVRFSKSLLSIFY